MPRTRWRGRAVALASSQLEDIAINLRFKLQQSRRERLLLDDAKSIISSASGKAASAATGASPASKQEQEQEPKSDIDTVLDETIKNVLATFR